MAIVLMGMSAAAAGPNDDAVKTTLTMMQGNWTATEMTESGIEAGEQRLNQMAMKMDGDVLSLTNTPEEAVRLVIDPSTKPMRVEWLDRHGWTTQGVITVSRGKIDVCFAPTKFNEQATGIPAPNKFSSTAENGATQISFAKRK
jgi:uncharacterized protein (TIGR03067 family)